MKLGVAIAVWGFGTALAGLASAETSAPEAPSTPAPYVLPWQLRSAGVANVVRSDTAVGFYEPDGADSGGRAFVTFLTFAYKLGDELAPFVRVGFAENRPPELGGTRADSGSAFLNPTYGVAYAPKLGGDFRMSVGVGSNLPVGSGGGDSPDPATAAALAAGVATRSYMDGAPFTVNYLGFCPGVDVAYVASGLTVQVEATLVQYLRVRGENNPSAKDSARTNTTSGIFVGYFVLPPLSVGAELRYQRWLKNPSVADGAKSRDNLSFAVGPRFHFQLGDKSHVRPGIAYARGIDKTMSENNFQIVQLDVPISF